MRGSTEVRQVAPDLGVVLRKDEDVAVRVSGPFVAGVRRAIWPFLDDDLVRSGRRKIDLLIDASDWDNN